MAMQKTTPTRLDMRDVAPRERHGRIFATFAALKPGGTILLVTDHDPKPLYYQFMAEHPGEVAWEYVEQGPEVWRVRIGKLAADAAGRQSSA